MSYIECVSAYGIVLHVGSDGCAVRFARQNGQCAECGWCGALHVGALSCVGVLPCGGSEQAQRYSFIQ